MAKQQLHHIIHIIRKNEYHSPCTASCVTLSPEVLGLESRCPNKQENIRIENLLRYALLAIKNSRKLSCIKIPTNI